MPDKRIYLDHNATTKLHPAVMDEMIAAFKLFGNPSSPHSYGQEARQLVDRARQRVACLIGAKTEEIIFTGSGTESCNLAIRGIAEANSSHKRHIITTSIEHQAVLNTCRFLEQRGFRITYLPVDANGVMNLQDVENAIKEDTFLLTIMRANNEIGTIQPVAEAVAMAKAKGILVHTDAIQAIGKMSVNVNELGVDLLSFSAHKFHGPKGIGALYLRHGVKLTPLLRGGHQEHGLRAGTENVPAITGFGKACELAEEQLEQWTKNVKALRDPFENGLLNQIPGIQVNGYHASRIPNTSNISFGGVVGEFLAINLDLAGVAVSTGAACQTNDNEPSHVLLAMGKTNTEARNSIRFSFDIENTSDEVDMVIKLLRKIVPDLRRQEAKQ